MNRTCQSFLYLLLLLSVDIHLNPGPFHLQPIYLPLILCVPSSTNMSASDLMCSIFNQYICLWSYVFHLQPICLPLMLCVPSSTNMSASDVMCSIFNQYIHLWSYVFHLQPIYLPLILCVSFSTNISASDLMRRINFWLYDFLLWPCAFQTIKRTLIEIPSYLICQYVLLFQLSSHICIHTSWWRRAGTLAWWYCLRYGNIWWWMVCWNLAEDKHIWNISRQLRAKTALAPHRSVHSLTSELQLCATHVLPNVIHRWLILTWILMHSLCHLNLNNVLPSHLLYSIKAWTSIYAPCLFWLRKRMKTK